MGTVTKGFDARLANRPFLFLTFGHGHSGVQPWLVSQPGFISLNYSVSILGILS